MANYVVKVLGSTETLDTLERTIRQSEELGFVAVSVAAGTVGGKKGNLLTLLIAAPQGTVTLETIDGSGDGDQQSDRLDALAGGGAVVSYGGVYVGGTLTDVAMIRA